MAEYTTKDTGIGNPNKGLFAGQGARVSEAPIEQRLRYDSTATNLHSTILSRLIARRRLSERSMTRRYDAWGRVDDHCRLFIDLNRKAKNADGSTNYEVNEMPWARSVVVPVSYAILQVYLTQLMGIYTRRDPPIEIYGVGPEDVRSAKLMNAVIAYDQIQTNYTLELYTALQDAMKYGCGGFHDCWEQEYGYKTDVASKWAAPMLKLMGLPTRKRIWGKRREYNKVHAWDPYNFFPDPRVSLSNIQSGEFWCHRIWRGYLEICTQSQENGGPYFNTDRVKYCSPKPQALRQRNKFAASQMNLIGSMDERDKGFHAIDSMLVNLIPAEWQLGEETRPELWHFAWVDDQCIIRAHKSEYEHGQAHYSAFESNIDTHVFGNQGSIENMDGLQRFMNWCYSDDTEILTERGWSKFQDLTEVDKVATVSADARRKLTFEKPTEYAVFDYDDEMVQVGGTGRERFDLLVTPNHRMWIQKRKAKTHRTVIEGNTVRVYDEQWWTDGEFLTADKLRSGHRMPNTVDWSGGEDNGKLILPAERSPLGRVGRPYNYPEMAISYDVLAPFIGWFVSEGSTAGAYVRFVQKNPESIPDLDLVLKRFPKKFNRFVEKGGAVRWQLHDWRLANWLRENCGDGFANKKLPAVCWQFGRRLLRAMIEAAIMGDGHKHRENLSVYYSSSKQLIDDMQIAALRAGFEASVVPQKRKLKPHHAQAYHLNIVEDGDSRQAGTISRVPYKGKVYCVVNSTHLLVVRRNGRVAVCGNTWNSHLQNQIRHINNRLVYDPSLLEADDVENPDAAMHIRLTAKGQELVREGRVSIQQMYQQMNLSDMTMPLVQSVNQMFDFAMRMSGAADQMMGRQTSEKRTLGEIQRVGHEGSARMAMHAGMMDAQGVRPLVLRWASNRQQFTGDDQWIRIAGDDVQEFGGERFKVKPDDLYGNYDYRTPMFMDSDEQKAISDTLVQGLSMMLKSEAILALPDKNGRLLDPHEFLKEAMRLGKVKNVNDFYKDPPTMGGMPGQMPPGMNVRVAPDEEVAREAERGNIVPMQPPMAA